MSITVQLGISWRIITSLEITKRGIQFSRELRLIMGYINNIYYSFGVFTKYNSIKYHDNIFQIIWQNRYNKS